MFSCKIFPTLFGGLVASIATIWCANVQAEQYLLEYEGYVYNSYNGGVGYSVGDPISGNWIIDISLAGSDLKPLDPTFAEYRPRVNWIESGQITQRTWHGDWAFVQDEWQAISQDGMYWVDSSSGWVSVHLHDKLPHLCIQICST